MDASVSPSASVTIADKQYTLDPSFATLRSIQQAFNLDIVAVQASILDMRQDEVAKLISLGSNANETEIGQAIFDELDVAGTDYFMLKAALLKWLAIAMTPKRDREKKSQQIIAIIDRLKANIPSPGETTSDSLSAPSDGSPANSGEATSGS
ncbi:hypothetical protein BH10PLA2_BH10PLA2_00680 [soil metagenome]